MSIKDKSHDEKNMDSECECGENKKSVTFEDAGLFVARFVGELELPKGVSIQLSDSMINAVSAAKNNDTSKIKENLDNFIKNVDELGPLINTSKKFPSGAFGYEGPSVLLKQMGHGLIECLPLIISNPIAAETILLATDSSCIDDCISKLATCLGLSSGALLLCGVGCLPALIFSPAGYALCISICAGLAGGVLAGVCFSNFIDCIDKCPQYF